MTHKPAIPFKNLDRDAWRRLGYLAIAVLYLGNAAFSLVKLGLYNGVGGDLFPFLTAGRVADLYGFAKMYDVAAVQQVQSEQLAQLDLHLTTFEPHPSPYFPVFMAPFKYISRIDMTASFWIWTITTFILLVAYFYSFIKRLNRLTGHPSHLASLLIPILVSYPVYTSFLYGQPEVFLLIFAGEFLLNGFAKKPFISGLWLGMLFIKPQALVLIIPALLIKRDFKTIAGFLVSAGAIVLSSTLIVGAAGMTDLLRLWFGYAPETEFFSPNAMANWRMAASNLNGWTNSNLGWVVAAVGSVITLILWFKLALKRYPLGTNAWALNAGAIFTASLAFTWHSHIHMGMVLIPFLIYLVSAFPPLGKKAFDLWVFTFPVAMMGGFILSGLLSLIFAWSDLVYTVSGFLLGSTGLGLYMLFTYRGFKLTAGEEGRAGEMAAA